MPLKDELVERYRRDGVIFNLRIVDHEEAVRYQQMFDEVEKNHGRESLRMPDEASLRQVLSLLPPSHPSSHKNAATTPLFDPHLEIPFIWELATNAILLDFVRSLLGPRIMLLCSGIACKYGPSSSEVHWHRDIAYLSVTPPEFVSAWYALDRSDQSVGCLEVIPGSHDIQAKGMKFPAPSPSELKKRIPLELESGEISLHHPLLLHGSSPNRCARRRCGLVFRYANVGVQLTKNPMGRDIHPVPL